MICMLQCRKFIKNLLYCHNAFIENPFTSLVKCVLHQLCNKFAISRWILKFSQLHLCHHFFIAQFVKFGHTIVVVTDFRHARPIGFLIGNFNEFGLLSLLEFLKPCCRCINSEHLIKQSNKKTKLVRAK